MIYELKAGGVDERRLVGAKLEKLSEGDSGEPWSTLSLLIQHLLWYNEYAVNDWRLCFCSDYKGKPTEAIRGGR